MQPKAEGRSIALFRATFGTDPEAVVLAPGRVNLIGDHTDYNDGFVLPVAIDRATAIAYGNRTDSAVEVVSEHAERAMIDLRALAHGPPEWAEYVRGVAWALLEQPPR